MKLNFKAISDFLLRNLLWFALATVSWLFMKPGYAEIQTFLYIVFLEGLAVALSAAALFAYTNIDFTGSLLHGGDKKFTPVERRGMYQVIGYIFLGVHLLVGLTVLGVYIAQFSH